MNDPAKHPGWLEQALDSVRYILGRYGIAPESIPQADTWARLGADLAARNLGLVPVEQARGFEWPGYWLAGLAEGDRLSAAVMFGSPSAVVWPPTAKGTVEFGFVVAPLDPALPLLAPYGLAPSEDRHGDVVGVYIAERTGAPMRQLVEAHLEAGKGITGDRYAAGQGTFSGPIGHEVTLVEVEVENLPGLAELEVSCLRRNIVTRGIDLNRLVGRTFRVGDARLVGRRLCEPCRHLENLAEARLITPLVHRAGLRADIIESGTVRLGDHVWIDPSSPAPPTSTADGP
jgi:hypothetical protein